MKSVGITRQTEGRDVEDKLRIDHAVLRSHDVDGRIDGLDRMLDLHKMLLRHQIDLVEDDAVGKSNLEKYRERVSLRSVLHH